MAHIIQKGRFKSYFTSNLFDDGQRRDPFNDITAGTVKLQELRIESKRYKGRS